MSIPEDDPVQPTRPRFWICDRCLIANGPDLERCRQCGGRWSDE